MRRLLILAGLLAALGGCDPIDAPVDFATLEKTDASNQYLVCPPRLCRGQADETSPEFDLPVDALAALVRRVVASEPRTALLREEAATDELVYVQRSLVFRFPDTIWIQPVALDAGRSSLAIYSRSAYGRYDFGVNQRRVRDWLAAIVAAASAGG
jgi:uncharacterized protein (DUF1499 family)